jgi:flagellar basal-body rod protein FlgB
LQTGASRRVRNCFEESLMPSIVDGTTIPLLEKIAVFGERRNTVLAANVANIDTPNYHRRDLPVEDFERSLRDAIHGGTARNSQASAGPAGLPPELLQAQEVASPSLTFQDNSNRSIEREMMEMTKNLSMQSFAITLLTSQMNMLQAAIREQV